MQSSLLIHIPSTEAVPKSIATLEMAPIRKPSLNRTLYVGNFVWTPSLGQLKVLENAAVGVDNGGIIAFILEDVDIDPQPDDWESCSPQLRSMLTEAVAKYGWKGEDWDCMIRSRNGLEWWFPGFVGAYHT